MKRLILLIFTLTLILSSCATVAKDPLSYQNGALSAEVVFERNGVRISAVIRLGPMSGELRDVEIRFSSPEGLHVVRKNGECYAELGGVSISPDPRLFLLCDLFSLEGSIVSVKTGRKVSEITLSVGQELYTVCFNSDDKPIKISGEGFKLDIIWIEIEK